MAKLWTTIKRQTLDKDTMLSSLGKVHEVFIGKEADRGLLFKLFLYLILIDVAYIYLNPILYMMSNMVKDAQDILDPEVIWLPKTIYLGVLQDAWRMLDYLEGLWVSLGLSTSVALLQTVFCAVAGYAFARLDVPLKNFWYFCLLLTFIVPPQVVILPNILLAKELGLLNTLWPLILPAVFGHGLKGALFVIIFRQFFSTQPKELEEAAKIDGAGVFRVFFRVMFPLARPAIIVVFLFSFVWTWNDFYYPSMYLFGHTEFFPLSMGIASVSSQLAAEEAMYGPNIFQESIKMATSFLMILPPLILYLFTQRWFVEGVERTGLVE